MALFNIISILLGVVLYGALVWLFSKPPRNQDGVLGGGVFLVLGCILVAISAGYVVLLYDASLTSALLGKAGVGRTRGMLALGYGFMSCGVLSVLHGSIARGIFRHGAR